MKRRVGILTAGGDCPGLNATIRGAAKALYERFEDQVQIVGIRNGYLGLMEGDCIEMQPQNFSNLLTRGGTILGTARTPFKQMKEPMEDGLPRLEHMVNTYRAQKLDALLCLGGNGSHKTACLLAQEGVNIIGLPKTIDNDIWGTDITFGFHTAVDIATDVIDRIHTTASSHRRVIVIELMGNKAGWLTLYSGIAGGADIIIIPERPYDIGNVVEAIEKRNAAGKHFSILAVAEGAMDKNESGMKRGERIKKRAEMGIHRATERLATDIAELTGFETRITVPGHIQRGGTPSAYDRVLATEFGTYAAKMVEEEQYGYTVAMKDTRVVANRLVDVAGKSKLVDEGCELIAVARRMGLSLG